MLRVPTLPLRQRSAGDLPSIPENSESTERSQSRPVLSRSHGDVSRLQPPAQTHGGATPESGGLSRPGSAEFLSPILPFAEIPPEKGLRRCRSLLRQVARKARKNILHHSTHDCSIPSDCREQLKHIYVY
ncbi:uncharacterized protein LOC122377014 [Amphibalanus amphitrite]|uniref:uncharacterized protein LOC122377014 n=1 Tax=Amphibalanus amphitrite TaxID=1232801 RepID=UPI001C8FBE14|nr:uncharacterized protein LOC122377014 [Amphibalanus amphitrite]